AAVLQSTDSQSAIGPQTFTVEAAEDINADLAAAFPLFSNQSAAGLGVPGAAAACDAAAAAAAAVAAGFSSAAVFATPQRHSPVSAAPVSPYPWGLAAANPAAAAAAATAATAAAAAAGRRR